VRAAWIAAALAACASAPSAPGRDAAPIVLTIVGTNDLHGWVLGHRQKLPDGETLVEGGLPILSSFLASLRRENPGGVVLLDAGDLFQGTLAANVSEGAVVIAAYNALGYDAASLGNHEFDYGPVGPQATARAPGDDPFGALRERIREARFPVLGRNVRIAQGGPAPFLLNDGLVIIERQGVKIGLVGLLTPQTPRVTNPINVQSLQFGDLAAEARLAVQELRQRGAEILIALVHVEGACAAQVGQQGCPADSELVSLLSALPPATFDAVVAGHSHTRIGQTINRMPVIESRGFGTEMGIVELHLDPTTHRPLPEQTRIRPGIALCERVLEPSGTCSSKDWRAGAQIVPAKLDGKVVTPDATMERLLAPYLEKVAQQQERRLGTSIPSVLTRSRSAESPLGDAFADALRALEHADVALLNSGGLRADLAPGELTYGALYEVIPFENTIATLRLTSAQMTQLVDALLASGKGVPQFSGVRIVLEGCGTKARVKSMSLADGAQVAPGLLLTVVTNDFVALGGDGADDVLRDVAADRKAFGWDRPVNLRDALAGWFSSRVAVLEAKTDGRLRFACPGP
jgi:5'-nucleotidase